MGIICRLVAYNGRDTTILNEERNVKICALLNCQNDKCGESNRVESLGFTTLEISANFDGTDNPLPISLVDDYNVVEKTEYNNGTDNVNTLKTTTTASNVNIIGLITTTRSGANSIQISLLMMFVGFLLHHVLKY